MGRERAKYRSKPTKAGVRRNPKYVGGSASDVRRRRKSWAADAEIATTADGAWILSSVKESGLSLKLLKARMFCQRIVLI
jgi:hypothetical protein